MAQRGQELQRVEDDERRAKRKSLFERFFGDPDDVFAYETFKVVRIRDKWLGVLYWGIILVCILYIAIKAIAIDGLHREYDPGFGASITHLKGKGWANGDKNAVMDEADLRFPVIEPAGAFVLTRSITIKDQTFGSCVNYDNLQKCPCSNGAVCNGEYCETQGWCPSIGDENAANPPPGAKVIDVSGIEDATLMIHSGIAFPFAGNYLYVARPERGTDLQNITLKELLALAQPPLTVEELSATGAVIDVSLLWTCELTTFWGFLTGATGEVPMGLGGELKYCPYQLVVSRIDGGRGFAQKRAHRKKADGTEKRDATYAIGLRIIIDSSGVGQRVSLVLILIQAGSMCSLLRVAAIITDAVMLSSWSSMSKFYEKCKVQKTRDRSDLKDRLDMVDDERQRFDTTKGRRLAPTSSKHSGHLGLGGGGRGGSGSTVLRGRR